jgi:hypothetical protein
VRLSAFEFHWPRTPADTVALTSVVSAWLERAGVNDGERRATLAVGIADSLAAAAQVADELELMLATDPTTADGAEAALTAPGSIDAWLFTELKNHVSELEGT